MEDFGQKTWQNIEALRKKRPLIHHITNMVVMNTTANATLAIGASPVMAHSPDEVEEMVSFAGALVLNIGTPTRELVQSMIKAGQRANQLSIPVVLDPVGVGATSLRTAEALKILEEVKVKVIRGNPAEILSLGGERGSIKGVESFQEAIEAVEAAISLATKLSTTLAVTGKEDFVTDGNRSLWVANGHPLMKLVTGTGCIATTVIAAFATIDPDLLSAAATALGYFGLAGEKGAQRSGSPGSFQVALFDALYDLTEEELRKGIRIGEHR